MQLDYEPQQALSGRVRLHVVHLVVAAWLGSIWSAYSRMNSDAEYQFCELYWQWLRSDEPLEPELPTFDLSPSQIDGLKRQCQIEFKAQRKVTE